MTLMHAVEAVRDYAGFAAIILFGLLAALLWTGAAGVSTGVAAAIAATAAGAVAAIVFYGLLSAATGAAGWLIALIGAVFVIAGGFASAQFYGVRGFWIFFTLAAGAGGGGLLMWLFERGATAPIGPLSPMMAAAVFLFVVFGALGSVTAVAGATPDERRVRLALADLTRPPAWFDCAYATFGGEAEQPGRCPFTPRPSMANPNGRRTPMRRRAEICRCPRRRGRRLRAVRRSRSILRP